MIVVFGSFNIDVVMRVARLPRPGETVLGGDYRLVPGGKGANQACAAARAATGVARGGDIPVAMVGKVGTDAWGDLALSLLDEAGVELGFVERGRAPTGCAVISVDAEGENAIAVASGANLEAEARQVPDSLLGPGDWLVLQMEVPPEENRRLIARARARGAKVLLNWAPAPPAVLEAGDPLADVDILVANEDEALAAAGASGPDADPVVAAAGLGQRLGVTSIVTLGPEGLAAFSPGTGTEALPAVWRVAALPVGAVDTTGAGDAFTGILAVALHAGTPLPEALHRASVGAGLCCATLGAQTSFPWNEQIERRLGDLAPARRVD